MDWILRHWLEWLFGLLGGMILGLCGYIRAKFKKQTDIDAGVQALLYDKIYYLHGRFCRQGFIPVSDFENVTNIYEAYHKLGGNGAGTKLYEDMKALPNYAPVEGSRGK